MSLAKPERVLVKLGGTLLDEDHSRKRLAAEITAAQRPGLEMVVVHGGGKQMTRFLAERNVESRFVNGLRVTTPEVVDAVLKVFAGTVNHQLVAALVQAGSRPVGLTGIDAALLEAEQLDPALGAVGRPVRCNPEILSTLVSNGFLPVVACVAGDRKGNIYNVNADQMAASIAASFGCERVLFLTDVQGVLDANKQILGTLTRSQSEQLIAAGVATGGMQAKLESAHQALRNGVREVCIAPGDEPGILARLLEGQPSGTRLVASP
ncbi:MAG: acetylglutamate kinase [Acidobacteriia bacterium]|nr:acetylglutamate kinase [Terriglobia bacterium]